jgi:NAD-dependent dihydropyrimidine dehydrogenase PreA subunit
MKHLVIDTSKCVGCGKCASICMKDNIKIVNKKAVEQETGCMQCAHCVSVCPKGAIRLDTKKEGEKINDDTLKDFLSKHKNSKWFDGRMISDEEFALLFDAAYYSPTGLAEDCVVMISIKGERLDAFMELVWDIVKDKSASVPVIREWEDWRRIHNALEPNPILWEGKQVLFFFAKNAEDALIATAKLEKKGFTMGICGFYSNVVLMAAREAPDRMAKFFGDVRPGKKMYCAFVIGHGRRMVEPLFTPIKKIKSLFR